jgi:AcrR family transcriptional regulator
MANVEPNLGQFPTVEADRRRQIIEAANDLFLEFGYDGATLDMLIERTGGSRRTIYNLFGSKEGLLEAIVTERCTCLAQEIEALSLEGLAPREMLQKLGLAAMRTILSPQGVKLFRLVVQESVRNPQLGRLMYESGVAVSQERLADYFKRETRAGRLNVRHPGEASSMFFAMIKGDLHFIALFWGFEKLTDAHFNQRVQRSVDIFLDGVSVKA